MATSRIYFVSPKPRTCQPTKTYNNKSTATTKSYRFQDHRSKSTKCLSRTHMGLFTAKAKQAFLFPWVVLAQLWILTKSSPQITSCRMSLLEHSKFSQIPQFKHHNMVNRTQSLHLFWFRPANHRTIGPTASRCPRWCLFPTFCSQSSTYSQIRSNRINQFCHRPNWWKIPP